MLLLIPLEGVLRRFEPKFGAAGCLALFLLFRDVNEGFLGAYGLRFLAMPEGWYSNYFSTFLGFPPQHFSSADYFSLFPWIFLFVMGYFSTKWVQKKVEERKNLGLRKISALGRRSFVIYVMHQPVIFMLLWCWMYLIG